MRTQPTALAQLRHLYKNMLNGGVRDTASAKRIAEGLLGPAIEALERGAPATGGEPVYAFRRKGLDDFCTCDKERYEELSDKPNLFETCILYTSPQPVREPLSRKRVKELVREAGYDTAPVQHRADFINGIRHGEAAHGIKGGQHGTDT